MYKIRIRDRRWIEINPIGKSVEFERVGYTEDAEVADYYRTRIGIIAVEEVEKKGD